MKIIGKLDAIHFLIEDAYGGHWLINHLHPFLPPILAHPLYDHILEEVNFDFAA